MAFLESLRQIRPLRSLRPYAAAAAWLLAIEVCLRITLPPDERVRKSPLPVYGCAADDELVRLYAARQAVVPADTLDVVLVGDSVLGSVNNPPGERLQDYLGAAMSQALMRQPGGLRQARIYNLSIGGARAADVYGSLLRLTASLENSPSRLRNLVVVLSSNVIFFSRRHSQPPMLWPCLLDDAAIADGDTAPTADALRRRLSLPPPPRPIDKRIAGFLAEHVYLYQQRRRIAELVLGGPPRSALRERLQSALHPSRKVATPPDYAQYAPNYDFIPLDSPEAQNHAVTLELARYLGQARAGLGLQALVVMTPHNHGRLGAITSTDSYRCLSAHIADVFRSAGVRFVSYDRDPGIVTEMFLDLDHLTAAGNQALAARIAGDLAAPVSVPRDP